MLIRTNQIKREITTKAEAEAWLDANPHRKAETMTGVTVDHKVAAKSLHRPDHLFALPKDDHRTVPLRKEKARSGGRGVSEANRQAYLDFKKALLDKRIVKQAEVKDMPKYLQFKIIAMLRDQNIDVITLTGKSGKALGWVLMSTLEELTNG